MSERPGADRPDRPALPGTLWALVVVTGCARVALATGPESASLLCAGAGVLTLAGLACLALSRTRARAAAPLALTLGVAASCACVVCAGELARQEALAGALSTSPVSSWELTLETDMSEGASGWRGRARVSGEGGSLGRVWLLADEPVELGTTLRCVGRFEENEPGDWGASSRAQGLAGTVRVARVLESAPATGAWGAVLLVRSRVLESLDAGSSDARALLAGAICGSTVAMAERGLDEIFATCGISHLVAVSGGHLVLVGAFVGAALSRTRLGPLPRSAALLASTLGFVVFCGAPSSASRAWVMSLVAELSQLVGRRAHPLSSASAAALAMALADPGVTGQLGYLLSVSCVCGICALGGYARYLLRVLVGMWRVRGRVGRALWRAGEGAQEALALTLVSQAVTAPLTCATFSRLSLVAPVANVVLAPLFSALLALGLAAGLLVWAPAAQAVALAGGDVVGAVVMELARLLAGVPMASVAVSVEEGPALAVLAACLAALLVAWPRVTRRALAGCLAVALAVCVGWWARWRLFAPACVRVLDVGQGDAILVTDGAATVLVDTGPGDEVLDALARCNVTHLDAVVITHLHDDHTGGLEAVLSTVGADLVVVGAGVAAGTDAAELSLGDVLRVGRFSLACVWPEGPTDGTENADSLELLLTYDDGRRSLTALLTGDAELEETSAALAAGRVGDVDLLKVGHHGSASSVSDELARALDAEVAVASAGEGNPYGHPDPACVDALEGAGSRFLCTKDVGDVCVEPGEEGPVVSCQRGKGQ